MSEDMRKEDWAMTRQEGKAPCIDRLIDAELDRPGWSSETAPEGESTLDCWNTGTTEQDGIVTLHDPQEVTAFYAVPLLETLRALPDDVDWDTLWDAILPHMVEEA